MRRRHRIRDHQARQAVPVGDADHHHGSHPPPAADTVGALVMDEQLFDDLQELARDLKHNPWKFFWKE